MQVLLHDVTVRVDNGVTPFAEQSFTITVPVVSATMEAVNSKSAEIDSPQIEVHELKVYPNPFSDRLRFEFVATEDVNARIDMYDMSGRMVKTIFEQPVQAE